MPKNVLHKILADHNDVVSLHDAREVNIGQAQFSCDTEDLVVSFPFVEPVFPAFHLIQTGHKQLLVTSYWLYAAQSFEANELRGPPATA